MKNQLLLFLLFSLYFLTSCNTDTNLVNQSSSTIKNDSIPFEVTEGNNIKFLTVLNDVDTLDLFFDTGGTDLVILDEAIKNQTTLLDGKNENYKGEMYETLEELNTISIGQLRYDSMTIFSSRIGPEGMAGHFGWDLFDDEIVELNYDEGLMILHNSEPTIGTEYEKVAIEYVKTLFCLKGEIKIGDQSFGNRYLFDTGFQRTLILDKELRAEENFPENLPVIKKSELRNSAGTLLVNNIVNADQFCFGKLCTKNVPTTLLTTPNPARFKTNILGNELLKRYNTIFDFKNNYVYLKPNKLMDLPYTDAS